MELICLLISIVICSSYYALLKAQREEGVLYILLTASLLTCGQIILTELCLGLLSQLYLVYLIILNLSIAGLVLFLGHRLGWAVTTEGFKKDILAAKRAARTAIDGYALVLSTIVLLTYGWILTAAYFLPPRGLDDLAYHLPAIFEYIRSHEVRLLRDGFWQFAFPENGELLFLWPTIFTHDQRWVDGLNVFFVAMSVMTIYALFRQFDIREKDAFFSALLYSVCPVVLMLAGVNYVEIILSLFLLLSLYYSILFHKRGHILDLYAAGLSIGLLCGVKYTGILLAIPLQALIIPMLWRERWRHRLGYVLVILFACGWWYVRNAFLLGDPLYPSQMVQALIRSSPWKQGGGIVENIIYNIPYWNNRYPLSDRGIGSYDGGFGIVFWGMGISSWFYVFIRSLYMIGRATLSRLVLLVYLPVGFLILLMLPPVWVDVDGRFAVFIVVIVLFAFCEVLKMMNKDEGYVSIIKILCIALSLCAISLMSISTRPSYGLGEPISDAINHTQTSEYKYLDASIEAHAILRQAWEVLDLLTKDDPAGMNCSIASSPALYVTAPVYGSKLQNRVLNVSDMPAVPVDAFVCAYLSKKDVGQRVSVYDEGQKFTLPIRDIMAKNDYTAVVQTDHCCLMLRRDILNKPEKRKILLDYYRKAWPESVALAKEMAPRLDAHIPLVTSSEIGYGIRAFDMSNDQPDRVYLTFINMEYQVAARIHGGKCYTLKHPLYGYHSRKVLHVNYRNKGIDVYLNRRS
jgi:Dolichyl-phosphate-mannose-protein mannosyltransferase